jgi:DNA-binding transcriptional MerR regulator
MSEKPNETTLSLDDLSRLLSLDKRTIRYYIQIGLVPRPIGETRAARYDETHAKRLLQVKNFREAGLSLERIGEIFSDRGGLSPPSANRRWGEAQIRSHIAICPGVEISIAADESNLSPEQVRELIRQIAALAKTFNKEKQ